MAADLRREPGLRLEFGDSRFELRVGPEQVGREPERDGDQPRLVQDSPIVGRPGGGRPASGRPVDPPEPVAAGLSEQLSRKSGTTCPMWPQWVVSSVTFRTEYMEAWASGRIGGHRLSDARNVWMTWRTRPGVHAGRGSPLGVVAPPGGFQEHEAEVLAGLLVVVDHRVDQGVGADRRRDRGGHAEPVIDQEIVALDQILGDQAQLAPQTGGELHPDGDSGAVGELPLAQPLECVAEGVPVLQDYALTLLAGVAAESSAWTR